MMNQYNMFKLYPLNYVIWEWKNKIVYFNVIISCNPVTEVSIDDTFNI